MLEEAPWSDLITSVQRRRSYDARFFKPVCLVAVLDLIAEGEVEPSAIDPNKVIERFGNYVRDCQPDRADLGWRPLWHLSNDGAWRFTKAGRRVGPDDFGAARKPDSLGQFKARFDRIAVPDHMQLHWLSAERRRELRSLAIAMLDADNDECRALAAALAQEPVPANAEPLASPRGGRGDKAFR